MVLTGTLDDGTSGLAVIKRCGGLAVVQDPADAEFSSMPRSAIDHVDVDRIVPIRVLGQTLVDLVAEPLSDSPASDRSRSCEIRRAQMPPRLERSHGLHLALRCVIAIFETVGCRHDVCAAGPSFFSSPATLCRTMRPISRYCSTI